MSQNIFLMRRDEEEGGAGKKDEVGRDARVRREDRNKNEVRCAEGCPHSLTGFNDAPQDPGGYGCGVLGRRARGPLLRGAAVAVPPSNDVMILTVIIHS